MVVKGWLFFFVVLWIKSSFGVVRLAELLGHLRGRGTVYHLTTRSIIKIFVVVGALPNGLES